MNECLVTGLRGIEIGVPDLEAAARFYVDTWHLTELTRRPNAVYFRGTGAAHHILTLVQSERADVRAIEFSVAEVASLDTIAAAVAQHGGTVVSGPAPTQMPGGGTSARSTRSARPRAALYRGRPQPRESRAGQGPSHQDHARRAE